MADWYTEIRRLLREGKRDEAIVLFAQEWRVDWVVAEDYVNQLAPGWSQNATAATPVTSVAPVRPWSRLAIGRLLAVAIALVVLVSEVASWFSSSIDETRQRLVNATGNLEGIEVAHASAVVLIVDTFSSGIPDHGDRMAQRVVESCPIDCAVARVNLGATLRQMDVEDALRQVLEYVRIQTHVQVIVNMSFGSFEGSAEEQRLVRELVAAGTILVAAAGNDGATREVYPAAYPEVIAVGNANHYGIASSSNRGDWVDLFADGYFRTIANQQPQISGGQQLSFSIETGTSFSSACVSGLLAGVASGRRVRSEEALASLLQAARTTRGGLVSPFRVRWEYDRGYRRQLYTRMGLGAAALLALAWASKSREVSMVRKTSA